MKRLAALIATIIVLAGGLAYYVYQDRNTSPKETITSSTPSAINISSVQYKGIDGSTALSLLQKAHKVEVKNYSFGSMVQSIDGVANTDNKSWILYINGSQATVGADAYITTNSDQIEWKFEEVKF